MPAGLLGTLIFQLREIVRGAVDERIIVLPHLDLLTTSQGGLTAEAREVIPLLYENPNILWIGFKDPSFDLPKVIENLFPHREIDHRHRPRSAALPRLSEGARASSARGSIHTASTSTSRA